LNIQQQLEADLTHAEIGIGRLNADISKASRLL